MENAFFYTSRKCASCRELIRKEHGADMKYTQTYLDKIENIVGESGYIIRYERGNFQSGYCILQEKKVVVLNKFLQTEGRINTLIDLIPQLSISYDALTHESQKLYDEISVVEVQH